MQTNFNNSFIAEFRNEMNNEKGSHHLKNLLPHYLVKFDCFTVHKYNLSFTLASIIDASPDQKSA